MNAVTDKSIACFMTEKGKWNAVVERDEAADGVFVYAVKTTGVFCRPSCASRQPNRVNVTFFSTCAEAEKAGYRACKRCQPRTAPTIVPEAVSLACNLIEQADEPLALNDLAELVGLSPFYLHRLFKAVVGVTPKAYGDAKRVERFRNKLREHATVTEAMYDAGFGSSSRCYEGAVDNLGMTPAVYKHGGVGHAIRFAIARCDLGWIVVAATQRGVCLIEFGDEPDDLRDMVANRFFMAELVDGDAEFEAWVTQVLQLIEAPKRGLNLPLHVQGTAFQQRVWKALQAIPVGKTATYAEVAKTIGSPGGVRAVASACASNPIAVAIPCHRVIGKDGNLTGYRWGKDRKRALLDREAGRPMKRKPKR